MREHMQARLAVLRQEFEKGQAELEKIEQQQTYVREMMLRISGAIQVLEDLLADERPADQTPNYPSEMQPITQVNGSNAEQTISNPSL